MDPARHISDVPLFEGLSDKQLARLAAIASEKSVGRGGTVFSEGDQADGFYVVESGQVRVYKLSPDGKEQILHVFESGSPLGEVAVFAGERFPAHAAAIRDSRLLYFPRDAFIEVLAEDPSLALNMLALLSRRLRRFAALVESLSLKEAPGRLAAYLLHLSEQNNHAREVELPVPKSQLANLLGTIPETLSRILARMTAGDLISSPGGREITLLDLEGLAKLARGESRLP